MRMRRGSYHSPVLWLYFGWVVSAAGKKEKKDAQPVLLEAGFKSRLVDRLQASLGAAVGHLAWALGLRQVDGVAEVTKAFGTYELELEGGLWRSSCETDLDWSHDHVHLCALHKLNALAAFCEVQGNASEWQRPLRSLLRKLVASKREAVVAGLGLKRQQLASGGREIWLSEMEPGSGKYDLNLPIHAAAMLAVAQCGSALGDKDRLADLQMWIGGLQQVYPSKQWGSQPFHSNGLIWEALALVAASLPQGSEFSKDARAVADEMQAYMSAEAVRNPQAWSFSGSRALALSLEREGLKPSRKKQLFKNAGKFLARFMEIVPHLNASDTYTCGPLQGAAPLILALMSPGSKSTAQVTEQHVAVVLGMASKEVDLFQVRVGEGQTTAAAERIGKAPDRPALDGAFLRDAAQLRGENRSSLRIDDTAQCVLALSRTLKFLQGLDSSQSRGKGVVDAMALFAAMGGLKGARGKGAPGAAPVAAEAAEGKSAEL